MGTTRHRSDRPRRRRPSVRNIRLQPVGRVLSSAKAGAMAIEVAPEFGAGLRQEAPPGATTLRDPKPAGPDGP